MGGAAWDSSGCGYAKGAVTFWCAGAGAGAKAGRDTRS